MKPQTEVMHTPKWTAKRKSYMGNFSGFRVFRDGVIYKDHVNALTVEEAINRARNNMYSPQLEKAIEAYNALPAEDRVFFLKTIEKAEQLSITARK